LVAELVYQTGVYQRVVYNQIDSLRAQTLARSALKLARLQLTASQKAQEKLKNLGSAADLAPLVNRIWQTPVVLPPPVPPGATLAATQVIQEFGKNLGLNGRISVTIQGEGNKLNLNRLVWVMEQKKKTSGPVAISGGDSNEPPEEEKLRQNKERFQGILDQLLENRRKNDESFREAYTYVRAEDLVNQLEAWMSPKIAVANEEDSYSLGVPEPYAIKNAPLASLSELHMVKGFEDPIVSLVSDNFTATLSDGVNVNQVSRDLLASLLPELDERALNAVIERRSDMSRGGPFKSADEFWSFLDTQGDFKALKDEAAKRGVNFVTEETSYRVLISAESGNSKATWVAWLGNLPPPGKKEKSQDSEFKIDIAASDPNDIVKPGDSSKANANNKNDNKIPYVLYLKTDN
ncbi:MAG: general secretion pathway protein GspK, partial [Bdellovibrionales bacterium]|nr:general secretion pathway protein GspK [Bdellovibrionales bacterium]